MTQPRSLAEQQELLETTQMTQTTLNKISEQLIALSDTFCDLVDQLTPTTGLTATMPQPFPTPESPDTATAQLTENQLQRRIKLGVIMTPGLGFRDKIKVVRSVENQWDDQVERFVHDSAQVWANINNKTQLLNVSITEWDWTEFLEFLKWLIPLLLELFL